VSFIALIIKEKLTADWPDIGDLRQKLIVTLLKEI